MRALPRPRRKPLTPAPKRCSLPSPRHCTCQPQPPPTTSTVGASPRPAASAGGLRKSSASVVASASPPPPPNRLDYRGVRNLGTDDGSARSGTNPADANVAYALITIGAG